jgi:hypothetical protein
MYPLINNLEPGITSLMLNLHFLFHHLAYILHVALTMHHHVVNDVHGSAFLCSTCPHVFRFSTFRFSTFFTCRLQFSETQTNHNNTSPAEMNFKAVSTENAEANTTYTSSVTSHNLEFPWLIMHECIIIDLVKRVGSHATGPV